MAHPQSAKSSCLWPPGCRSSSHSSARLFSANAGRTGVHADGFHRNRNAYRKRTAHAVGVIPALNFSTMRAHYPVADAQSQPGALAGLLRRIERIEYSFAINDSGAVVGQTDLNR